MYFFVIFGDLICNTLAAILRVFGEDRFGLKGFLWNNYGIGLSCSLLFGVWLGFGFYGVWISLVLGFYVMLVISAIKLKKLDWEKAVHKVSTEHKRKSFNEVAKLETEMHDFV